MIYRDQLVHSLKFLPQNAKVDAPLYYCYHYFLCSTAVASNLTVLYIISFLMIVMSTFDVHV